MVAPSYNTLIPIVFLDIASFIQNVMASRFLQRDRNNDFIYHANKRRCRDKSVQRCVLSKTAYT